jgi:arginine N-succinyltransferase
MRGISDERGQSPFWQWLEEHFFSMDFPTVDYLTGIGQKQFIAELMPKYPIYVSLLSKEAQSVIGQVHEKTKPALKMLEKEGFSCRGYVDIFDAGPTVEANLKHVRTAQASCKLPVKIDDEKAALGKDVFAINTLLEEFRGASISLWLDKEQQLAFISQQAANALTVSDGDAIRFAPSDFRA